MEKGPIKRMKFKKRKTKLTRNKEDVVRKMISIDYLSSKEPARCKDRLLVDMIAL